MDFIKSLLTEINTQQQAELEAGKDLADLGIQVDQKNKALLMKKAKEKQKQINTLSQSDDPIDRKIAVLRKQIATLLAQKKANAQKQAAAATKV